MAAHVRYTVYILHTRMCVPYDVIFPFGIRDRAPMIFETVCVSRVENENARGRDPVGIAIWNSLR